MMSVDEQLILRQVLEELKVQSQYLFDIRKRLEDLESTVGALAEARAPDDDGKAGD